MATAYWALRTIVYCLVVEWSRVPDSISGDRLVKSRLEPQSWPYVISARYLTAFETVIIIVSILKSYIAHVYTVLDGTQLATLQ